MKNKVIITNEYENLRIEIKLQIQKFVKIILLFLFVISVAIPILIISIAISNNFMNLGLLIGISAFVGFITRFIFKQLMWHSYGSEIFIINKNNIQYLPFIKFFKSESTQFGFKKLEILFSDRELCKDERIGTLIFLEEENKLKSVLKISEIDFNFIKEKVQAYLVI